MNDIEYKRLTLEQKRIVNDRLYGKFAQEPEMDIFDKLNSIMDDFGIAKDDGRRDTVNVIESATQAAKFLAVISDPEERERAIKDALTQTYIAGMKAGK
jgi:hypothetical protein